MRGYGHDGNDIVCCMYHIQHYNSIYDVSAYRLYTVYMYMNERMNE